MAAIFNATKSASQMYKAGEAKASIGGVPAILLGVTINVSRQLTPIPTLTDGIQWSGQPAMGTVSAQSILSNKKGKSLLSKIAGGNACESQAMVLNMKGSCASSDITFNIADAYCATVGFSANGNQGYIGMDFSAQFTCCEIS